MKQTLIAIDQVFNTFFKLNGEKGMADETLSARAWRCRAYDPRWHIWIDRLFFWQKGHCKAAYESEMSRKHLPEEYRVNVSTWD